jgi:hypothetical protein
MKIRFALTALALFLLALTVGCPTNRGRGGGGGGGGSDDDDATEDDDDATEDDDDVVDDDDDAATGDFEAIWVEEYQGDIDCSELVIWMEGNGDDPPYCEECDYSFAADQGLDSYDCPAFSGELSVTERYVGFGNDGTLWLYLDSWTAIGSGSTSSDGFSGGTDWTDSGQGYEFRILVDADW